MSSTLVCEPAASAGREQPATPAARRTEAAAAGRHRWRHRDLEFAPHLDYAALEEISLDLTQFGAHTLLAAETESLLFRQMNLAAFRAHGLREALGADPTLAQLRQAHRQAERADRIRNTLAVVFSKLAVSIAAGFANASHPLDELVSEAQTTLLRAIVKFDPQRGTRFSTYATHALRRRLLRYLQSRQRERRHLVSWPDEGQLAQSGRWTIAYERRVSRAVSAVEKLLARLSSRERYIIRSRFGWGREFEPRTLQQIGDELGVSRERVRQLEARALDKLRALAGGLDPLAAETMP